MVSELQTRTLYIENNDGLDEAVTPCLLPSEVSGAVSMRFGNTRQEAMLSEWLPYSNRHRWYLRGEATGDGNGNAYPMCTKSVWGEYLLNDGQMILIEAVEGCRHLVRAKEILYPPIESMGEGRSSNYRRRMNFQDWHERWVSYQCVAYRGNVFYPVSHTCSRASNNKAYVWTDDSRWRIDEPETPNPILAMLCYFKWLNRSDIVKTRGKTLDMRKWAIQCGLKGIDLDLKGAQCYFWVESEFGRWHRTKDPLIINNERWVTNTILLDEIENRWTRTYSRKGKGEPLSLKNITSWGFSFIGFPQDTPVTGVFCMDHFHIINPAATSKIELISEIAC